MEILKTDDGSMTVRHELLGELYHSDRGAIGEAEHVYLQAGFEWAAKQSHGGCVSVFEVGFGTGLNTWLTYQKTIEISECVERVDYHSIELYPIDSVTVAQLNYTEDDIFATLHALPWDGERHEVTTQFTLTKYKADMLSFDFTPLAGRFDVIYFDAFASDTQPELWSEQIMAKMHSILKSGGYLVTYSSKGLVKQALRTANFDVTRLQGALGKRHMLRAVKL